MSTEIFKQFPILQGSNFTLRSLSLNDVEDFLKYMTHKKVSEFLSDEDLPYDKASAQNEIAYWKNLFLHRRSIYWGIEMDGKLVGSCGYNNWSKTHARCEISYDLAYDYWGKGIMTEAIGIITDFAFEKMDVRRVQATVAVDNIGSVRVLEKNLYKMEGRLKNYGILHNQSKDFFMFARVC